MASSQLPAVIDALVAQLTTALAGTPAVLVTDGVGVTEDPRDFLMIGVDDPTSNSPASGSSEQAMATMGTGRPRDETGTIICAAQSSNGNGSSGQKAARDAAYSYMAAVETLLRSSPSLGLTSPVTVVVQMGGTTSLIQGQDDHGADALLIFTVTYKIRI